MITVDLWEKLAKESGNGEGVSEFEGKEEDLLRELCSSTLIELCSEKYCRVEEEGKK